MKSLALVFSSLLVLGLAAAPAVASPSAPQAPSGAAQQGCALRGFTVTAVTPHFVDQQQGRATVQRLSGATVYVLAQPGLTREWLRLSLERHLTAMPGGAAMKDCPFGAKDLKIAVDSAGTGFAIHVIAKDAKTAEEVLRRARLLRG